MGAGNDLGAGIASWGHVNELTCPFLHGTVQLTAGRLQHVLSSHPELLEAPGDWIAKTLGDPDEVRASKRNRSARLISRWFAGLRGGKFVVVVVFSESAIRHRVVTAYVARRLVQGDSIWKRS
jgi:hypothetical protein